MAKRKSKYCRCKKPIPNYNKDNLICNKCKKIINVKVRKTWSINPKTQIKENDKLYNRKRDKKQYKINKRGQYAN